MNIRQKLASVLLVIFSLLAIQAQAQTALQGGQLTAYQTLSTALSNNATADEATDEAAVQAARDAGLSDESIAGAMQENQRSAEQQAAALLPANPTQAQVNAATSAIVNSTNSQGTANSTNTAIQVQSSVQTALTNSGVNAATAVSLASTAASNASSNPVIGQGGTPTPTLASTINTLPATATGQSGSLPPVLNSLTNTIAQSSGPAITETAVAQNIPTIPVEDVDFQTEPEPEIPEARPIHVF